MDRPAFVSALSNRLEKNESRFTGADVRFALLPRSDGSAAFLTGRIVLVSEVPSSTEPVTTEWKCEHGGPLLTVREWWPLSDILGRLQRLLGGMADVAGRRVRAVFDQIYEAPRQTRWEYSENYSGWPEIRYRFGKPGQDEPAVPLPSGILHAGRPPSRDSVQTVVFEQVWSDPSSRGLSARGGSGVMHDHELMVIVPDRRARIADLRRDGQALVAAVEGTLPPDELTVESMEYRDENQGVSREWKVDSSGQVTVDCEAAATRVDVVLYGEGMVLDKHQWRPSTPSGEFLGLPVPRPRRVASGAIGAHLRAAGDQVDTGDTVSVEVTRDETASVPASPPTEPPGNESGPTSLPPDPTRPWSLGTGLHLERGVPPRRVCLRTDDYARALATALRGARGETCLAVLGHWGRGKTFLMERVRVALASQDRSDAQVDESNEQNYACVWFSAWRYRTRPELWAYLYETVREAATDEWWYAPFRAARAALVRHGPLAPILLVLSFAVAATPWWAVIREAAPLLLSFLGVIGLIRLGLLAKHARTDPTGIIRRSVALASHDDKLGLQAAIGADFRALVLGWVAGPWTWWGRLKTSLALTGYAVACGLFILAVNCALASSDPTPVRSRWLDPFNMWGVNLYPTADDLRTITWVLLTLFALPPLLVLIMGFGGRVQRLLLIVDDLDRLTADEMIDVIEQIKLLLEDKDLREHVQVVMLAEEDVMKDAIASRVSRDRRCVEETFQKLFLAHLRMPPLDGREQEEVLRGLTEDQPVTASGKQPPSGDDASPGDGDDRDPSAPTSEPPAGSAEGVTTSDLPAPSPHVAPPRASRVSARLTDDETRALVECLPILRGWSVHVGPRAVQSLVIRYQLARQLLDARGVPVPASLARDLAQALAQPEAVSDHVSDPIVRAVLREVT